MTTTYRRNTGWARRDLELAHDDPAGHTIASTLDSLMSFGHVIQVHKDGTVTEPGEYGPEIVYVELDDDGQMVGSDSRDGASVVDMCGYGDWSLMAGYTGQYMSTGKSVIMHESEYIGGKMADDILSTPGYYVAVMVDGYPNEDDGESVAVGWAVAYKESEDDVTNSAYRAAGWEL